MAGKVFARWPPGKPFPEGQRDTLGAGTPDFPGAAAGREVGKYRPSKTPRLTTVAVVNDDGSRINEGENTAEEETNLLLRAVVLGLTIMTDTDLLSEVSN